MITAIELENFKCFTRLRLPFGSLTLLTGFNGGGKSSALQPLLLLSQSLFKASAPETYSLNGPLVRLGTVADVLPANTSNSRISFTVSAPENEIAWTFATRAGDRFLRALELKENSGGSPPKWSPAWAALLPRVAESLATLTYLSAVREGTADALRFLAKILIAVADDETDDSSFQLSPKGAGSFHFSPAADVGLYVHRLVPEDAG